MTASRIPSVIDGFLTPRPGAVGGPPIAVGSHEWYTWLDDQTHTSFSLQTDHGAITIRREQKRNTWYWYAYHSLHSKLRKAYVGKSADLTATHLATIARRLSEPPTAAPTNLRLRLLGSPTIERDNVRQPLPTGKVLALLGYLAMNERPVTRQHMQALLWPDSNERAAQKNLRNTLWQLRRDIGVDVAQGSHYLSLNGEIWVDSVALERTRRIPISDASHTDIDAMNDLHAAIDLYCGDFMDGITVSGAPDFELWLVTTREHLHEAHLRNLHTVARAHRRSGRWDDVIAVAHDAIARDVLQEPMYQLLMEAYAMQGDRAAALRHYDLLHETLARELGVSPLPASADLHHDILQGALQFAPPVPAVRALAIAPTGTEQPYIGRDDELATLSRAWERARAGRAQVVLVHGEAGIGKSRLWQVWTRSIGLTTLQTRCLSTTHHLPFAPLVDMLRIPAIRERLTHLARTTPPTWLSDLARLIPELRDMHPTLIPPIALPPEEEQRHIFEALFQSLGLSPTHPVALFVDDLHWADRATLDWLGYLVHRAEDLPLLLVGAYRNDEAPATLVRLQTTWGREGVIGILALARLNRAEAMTLVSALKGTDATMDTLYDQSAGNPFFLLELLRAEPGVVPSSLTDLIQQRLDRLSSITRQVVHAAAVLQEEIVYGLLQQTSGRTDEETLDALDELVTTELLVEHHHTFMFSHPLIALVVDHSLSGPRRVVLHRRAATALLRSHANQPSLALAASLARHFREAQDATHAAEYAEQAGASALTVAAPEEAAHFYAEALALAWTPARAYGYGRAMYRQGNITEARSSIERAIAGYEHDGDRAMAAEASLEMALTYFADNQLDGLVLWAQRGRDFLRGVHNPRAQAIAAYLLGAEIRISYRSPETAATYFTEALRLLTSIGEQGFVPTVLIELGNAHAQQGDLTGAIAVYRDLVARAEQSGSDFMRALGYNNLAYHLLLSGDTAVARATVDAGLAVARERYLPLARTWLWSTSGEIALVERRWDVAAADIRRSIAEAERVGNTEHVISCRVNLAIAAYASGNNAAARTLLRDSEQDAAALSDAYLRFQIDYWLTVVATPNTEGETPAAVLERASHELRNGDLMRMRWWLTQLGRIPDTSV